MGIKAAVRTIIGDRPSPAVMEAEQRLGALYEREEALRGAVVDESAALHAEIADATSVLREVRIGEAMTEYRTARASELQAVLLFYEAVSKASDAGLAALSANTTTKAVAEAIKWLGVEKPSLGLVYGASRVISLAQYLGVAKPDPSGIVPSTDLAAAARRELDELRRS